MATIAVRQLRRDDLPIYKSLRFAALRDHPESFGSAYEDVKNATDNEWLARIGPSLDGDNAIMFLADDEDAPAGILTVVRDGGSKVDHNANIYGVYVRPESRGKGVAERLVNEAIAWCRAKGIRIVRLTAVTSNAAAIRCYARCGFTICGVAPEVIRVGDLYHDELFMWRRV